MRKYAWNITLNVALSKLIYINEMHVFFCKQLFCLTLERLNHRYRWTWLRPDTQVIWYVLKYSFNTFSHKKLAVEKIQMIQFKRRAVSSLHGVHLDRTICVPLFEKCAVLWRRIAQHRQITPCSSSPHGALYGCKMMNDEW